MYNQTQTSVPPTMAQPSTTCSTHLLFVLMELHFQILGLHLEPDCACCPTGL